MKEKEGRETGGRKRRRDERGQGELSEGGESRGR